jgi:HB1, ASXL, restriction endonuclease HTH domain
MSVESTIPDPYELVLADLRAKKAQIDQAIAAIEALRKGNPTAAISAVGAPSNAPGSQSLEEPGAFLGKSIVDAAKMLLAAKRQPMRNPDIAAAFKRGGLVLNSKDPANTIGAVLARRAADVGDIVKVDRGTWGLKEWYPNRSFKPKPGADAAKASDSPTASEPPSAQPRIDPADWFEEPETSRP